MLTLLKYWPVIGTVIGLGANLFLAWICWSMRQWTRNEVEQLLAAERLRMETADARTDATVDLLDTRMTKVEGEVSGVRRDIGQLPTKADLARVEGEIKAVGHQATSTNEGIRRLEGFWLAKGVEGV